MLKIPYQTMNKSNEWYLPKPPRTVILKYCPLTHPLLKSSSRNKQVSLKFSLRESEIFTTKHVTEGKARSSAWSSFHSGFGLQVTLLLPKPNFLFSEQVLIPQTVSSRYYWLCYKVSRVLSL